MEKILLYFHENNNEIQHIDLVTTGKEQKQNIYRV